MLKIYKTRSLFQVNHQKWETCGSGGYCCKDESEVEKELVLLDRCSFAEATLKILDKDHWVQTVMSRGLGKDETDAAIEILLKE